MNCISSMRPLVECDPEWRQNQLLAKRTWEMAFQHILLFNGHDRELASGKTGFITSDSFPSIRKMAEAAGQMRGFTAILNADIVIKPEVRKLERLMQLRGKLCASSRRYHFDPSTCDWNAASLGDDRGRDIFIARQDIWRQLGRELPEDLRIGHGHWDAAITNVFRLRYDEKFLDFTKMKIVFHPVHQGRKRPFNEALSGKPGLVDPATWVTG